MVPLLAHVTANDLPTVWLTFGGGVALGLVVGVGATMAVLTRRWR